MSQPQIRRKLFDWNHDPKGGRALLLGNHPKESRPWPKQRWVAVHLSSRRFAGQGLLLNPKLRHWMIRWLRAQRTKKVLIRRLQIQAGGISFSMKVRQSDQATTLLRSFTGLLARKTWGAEKGRPRMGQRRLWDRRPMTMLEPEPPWKAQVFDLYFSILRWAKAQEMPREFRGRPSG